MASRVKKTISIHDFWNDKHDIITIEINDLPFNHKLGNILNIEDELIKLGYRIDNINWMDITRQKNEVKKMR